MVSKRSFPIQIKAWQILSVFTIVYSTCQRITPSFESCANQDTHFYIFKNCPLSGFFPLDD